NDKMLSEKLLNVQFTIKIQRTLPTEQRDWVRLRSSHTPVVEEEVRSQEEGAPKQRAKGNQKAAEHQHGIDETGVERRVQEHHQHLQLSNTVNKVKYSRKEARGKVSAVKATLPKVTLGNDKLHLGVPGSVVLQLGHPAIRAVSTLPHKPPQLPSTNQLKSRNSPATLGTNSVVEGVISDLNPEVATATCRPKNHIVFLKTHKTASSTILNILYRYGDSRNLTFALPLNKHSQLFYPFFFASHFVEGVRKVMPKDTFYFSILKNPVAMMESIFTYYKSIPAFHKAHSLDDFLDNGWRDYNTSLPNNHYARNILTFDFGFDNNVATETPGDLETRAATAIGAIEQDFHLILISEYFDESMILLKRALCWSLDDVVSFKLNSRSERARHMLSPHTADKIRAWNGLDWRLYLHFNATFWRHVDTTVGREAMRREVTRLQERRAELAKTCLKDGGAVDPSQVKDAGLKPFQYGAAIIQGYNLNPGLYGPTKTRCQNLVTPELQYTDTLYTKQFPELAARQRQAAKLAASQRQPGPAKVSPNKAAMPGPVRVREARHSRTARSGPRNPNAQNQNDLPPSALSKITAARSDRNMP
ncbi:unnamed protein product, partial [Coregonus sp. 'balchen']